MKQLADFTTHLFVTKGIVTEADAPIYAYGFEVWQCEKSSTWTKRYIRYHSCHEWNVCNSRTSGC